jgi:hypothetical protein
MCQRSRVAAQRRLGCRKSTAGRGRIVDQGLDDSYKQVVEYVPHVAAVYRWWRRPQGPQRGRHECVGAGWEHQVGSGGAF